MNKKIMMAIVGVIIVILLGYVVSQNFGEKQAVSSAMSITHEMGETHLNTNPEKVIVFDYANLDTLDALGVEVVGVVKSSLPNALLKYQDARYADIGTLFEPNFEEIAKIKPDVIFISGRQVAHYEALSKLAPTVYLEIDANDYIGSLEKNLTIMGTLFSKETPVKTYMTDLRKSIQNIQETAEQNNANALIVLTNDDKLSVYGPNSRFGIIHNTLKIKAVDEGIEVARHGQLVGFEYILEKNPEYIFVVNRDAITDKVQTGEIFENEVMKKTQAYIEGKIVYLDPEVWYLTSGGMSSTTEMIKEIEIALK